MVLAGLLPLGLLGLAGFRKRLTRTQGTLLLLLLLCVLTVGCMAGCGGGLQAVAPARTTPQERDRKERHLARRLPLERSRRPRIDATSGSRTHSVVVSLTVN
jgi:hypothetical protein